MIEDEKPDEADEEPVTPQWGREELVAFRLKKRQERLAKALRENLRKRKAQKLALDTPKQW